tara:strand:+ start:331 stop:558 length:228 start_codon:yes stop_codon:yes gene_type:complete
MPPQHPPPEPLPRTGAALSLPEALPLKNVESARMTCCPLQCGQGMGSSALAIERSLSKRVRQSEQKYSYNGMRSL